MYYKLNPIKYLIMEDRYTLSVMDRVLECWCNEFAHNPFNKDLKFNLIVCGDNIAINDNKSAPSRFTSGYGSSNDLDKAVIIEVAMTDEKE